jgi:hypothetical protein
VTFSPRTSNGVAQTATVTWAVGATTLFTFSAPATNPSLNTAPPSPVVTTHAVSGVSFFAGEVDDPFFFDIPAFNRFVASVLAGAPDPTLFNRARDSFAGYNTMAISLRIPASIINNRTSNSIGVYGATHRASRHFDPAVINISTRGRVDLGANVLIGGLIISGTTPKRVIVRGIGPTLTGRGVTGALLDPKLTLYNASGTALATNDNWQDTQGAEIAATPYAPPDPRESAIIATLNPGAYTAILSGVGGTTGVGLVEVFDLDAGTPGVVDFGQLHQVDRMGNPAVNVALVPFSRKDEYNGATPQDDAAGVFAGDIVGTLTALGTNSANINILAGVAVTNGDYLRLNLGVANSGPGGGNNAGAAYPNGRRLGDDTIDILLSFITNQSGIIDNVNANDVPLTNTFPFFAPAQQPRTTGVDDNTRN